MCLLGNVGFIEEKNGRDGEIRTLDLLTPSRATNQKRPISRFILPLQTKAKNEACVTECDYKFGCLQDAEDRDDGLVGLWWFVVSAFGRKLLAVYVPSCSKHENRNKHDDLKFSFT